MSADPTVVDANVYRRKVFEWARETGLVQLRLGIYQPKVDGASEWTCSMDELEAFAEQLLERAQAVRRADADAATMPHEQWWPLHLNPDPNEEECAFCRAMATCPAQQAKLQRSAAIDFGVVAEEGAAAMPDVTTYSLVQLNEAMKIVPLMEKWGLAVRAEIERQALAGVEFADFGLELGRQGNREFADPEAAEALLRRQFRLPIDAVYNLKLKSPTQVEVMTKATKAEDGTVVAPILGPTRWARVQELITRAPPKPSVKPKSAIKVAYKPTPPTGEGFAAVVDPDDLS